MAKENKVKKDLKKNLVIEAKNLSKIYGKKDSRFTALDSLEIAVKKGESVAIVGKSGSGKSTLMHVLATLDRPSSGELLIDGVATSKLSRKGLDKLRNEKFGFVFQQFFMNPNDSVLENVVSPLLIKGLSKKERIRRAKEAIESVDLTDKLNSKAKSLSGGQKQRVCIARALVSSPEVIFADEPTGNLDSVTGAAVEKLLFDLHKKHGITLIIVTHDADLSKKCQRIIKLKDGKIV